MIRGSCYITSQQRRCNIVSSIRGRRAQDCSNNRRELLKTRLIQHGLVHRIRMWRTTSFTSRETIKVNYQISSAGRPPGIRHHKPRESLLSPLTLLTIRAIHNPRLQLEHRWSFRILTLHSSRITHLETWGRNNSKRESRLKLLSPAISSSQIRGRGQGSWSSSCSLCTSRSREWRLNTLKSPLLAVELLSTVPLSERGENN